MILIQIILAFLAYSPLVALVAAHAVPAADGSNFASPKGLTNSVPPAKKLYTGPWSSFPTMNMWTGFDATVSSFKHAHPSPPSSFPVSMRILPKLPQESWLG